MAETSHPTVLLVDDDEWVRESLRDLLRVLGYEVVEASDGETAGAAVRAEPPRWAFVILDLHLPGMQGGDALAALLAERHDLPVLLHSGLERWQIPPKLFSKGKVGFLEKPAMLAELTAALRELRVDVPVATAAELNGR